MNYFVPSAVADLDLMITRGDCEGAHLEFKSSKLLNKNNDRLFSDLSKELTAFANSAGGVLIIGMEENGNRIASEVVPIVDRHKNDSWFEDGLLSRCWPQMQMSIGQIPYGDGVVIVINVPASRDAPHQAADKRFYARRLFRVDPLLPFEIDDIRRRQISSPDIVSLAIVPEDGMLFFEVHNQGVSVVFDVHVEIKGIANTDIAKEWRPGLRRPYTEPYRAIHPGEERRFPIAGYDFLKDAVGDELSVTLFYTEAGGTRRRSTRTHYIDDFANTYTKPAPNQKELATIGTALEAIAKELSELNRSTSDFVERTTHPSGLNLSLTTLTALTKGGETKWPGGHMDMLAIAEVLDVDQETAWTIWEKLYGAFHMLSGTNTPLDQIDLSDEVREKVKTLLKLP